MSLDIKLVRRGEEPWGFRLIGGRDFHMPLTVVKVQPFSPAETAGLRNGDTLLDIDGTPTASMSHEDAQAAIRKCGEEFRIQISRGLYDPVIDEQEIIFEPIEPEDFGQSSEPTEVFAPIPEPSPLGLERSVTPELRSLTASPFVLPTKPYRPFSTEPIPEVPTLEEPIILNPNYHDEFGKPGDDDLLPKTKYKLPISEQYDPNFGKEKKIETKSQVSEKEYKSTKHGVQFMNQMKHDIDLEKIETCAVSSVTEYEKTERTIAKVAETESREQKASSTLTEKEIMQKTASSIVDESITKAMTVAEEIKKEIDAELQSSEISTSKVETTDVKKLIATINKTTEDITSHKKDTKVSEKYDESISKKEQIKSSSARQELEETIVSGTVKRISASYDQDSQMTNVKAVDDKRKEQTLKLTETQVKDKAKEIREDSTVVQKRAESKISSSFFGKAAQKSEKIETKSDSTQKKSTARLLSEQRAYTIGLQTIPKIRGALHSSYHYNLLLKTFFIHLTDVMVALSRFILTEPVLDKEEEIHEHKTARKETEKTFNVDQEETFEEEHEKLFEQKTVEKREIIHDEQKTQEVRVEQEIIEKPKLSGSKMAQLTAKKSEELILGMDAVITEFQNKAGIEETSVIEETTQSDIKEKVSQEIPSESLSKKESSAFSQIISETKMMESMSEKKEEKERRSKSREGQTIYVATVESHVYTNKDAILSEQFSDTSSVQSAEETKVAEISETVATEDRSQDFEQLSKTEAIEESKVTKSEEIRIEDIANEREQSKISEVKAEKIKEVKIAEPVVEPEEINVEQKVIISKPKPYVELSEDIEATVKVIQTISPPAEVIELEDIEYSKTSTEESKTTSGAATTETYKSATVTEETRYQGDSDVHKSSFTAKSAAIKTIDSSEQSCQETLQQSVNLSDDGATQHKLRESLRKLSLKSSDSFPSTISTPTPATVPPTPLTDEYVFRLEAPMPKSRGPTPALEDPKEPSPIEEEEHEDPDIVKKKLIPHIEMKIERIVYDPPLPTPVDVKDVPVFAKRAEVGVISAESKEMMSEEEILEIERKSSLLASAIDETIKSIEEYKEQVGMETTKTEKSSEVREAFSMKSDEQTKLEDVSIKEKTLIQAVPEPTPVYNGYVKEAKTIIYADVKSEISKENGQMEDVSSKVVDQFKINTESSKSPEKSTLVTQTSDTDIKSSIITEKDVASSALTTDTIQSSAYTTENKVDSLSTTFTQKSEQSVDISTFSNSLDTMQTSTHVTDNKVQSATTLAQESQHTEGVSTFFKAQEEVKTDPMQGYRPVPFNPEEARRSASRDRLMTPALAVLQDIARRRSVTVDGTTLGTTQGIVDGLEDVVMDEGVAKELGKPGITEEKIAEIISGESEMLREAHVMGVDFKKIKPTIDSLKDSEVLKALNDELTKTKEEKKHDERKWTTFLQKPKRPTPKAKFGYHGWLPQFDVRQEPYKVKIVKQPKPKVAPDYDPEDFETGLLPWEERAANEPPAPPVAPEDPILIPEDLPEFLEAVDPLPESEVPDLEETGIPLPPEKTQEGVPEPTREETAEQDTEEAIELDIEKVVEETEQIIEDMEQNRLAEQLLSNVQSMVDPNATLEQQLAQMRAQLAALAQLPGVIQQSLELVTKQLMQITQQESTQCTKVERKSESTMESTEEVETTQRTETIEDVSATTEETHETTEQVKSQELERPQEPIKPQEPMKPSLSPEELERMRREEEEMIEEQKRIEKQNKVESTIEHYIYKHMNQQELMEQVQLEQESRLVKDHPTPRVGKPKPVFGPLTPQERPLVLPGGRKWRKPKDAYNEAFIAETLTAQAEIIQGKAKGPQYESYLLPYDQRVNFLKYEKPPISLDHLKDSDTYKMIHNMELPAPRRVELLTPVVAESDYREKCRSMTPCDERRATTGEHLDIPQQLQP